MDSERVNLAVEALNWCNGVGQSSHAGAPGFEKERALQRLADTAERLHGVRMLSLTSFDKPSKNGATRRAPTAIHVRGPRCCLAAA